MKINVHEIPSTGLSLEETGTGAEFDLAGPGMVFTQLVTIRAEVQKIDGVVEIALTVKSAFTCNCDRCLEKMSRALQTAVTVLRPVKGESEIDITQLAREEVLLGYPQKWLCRDDCKGLCVQCGRNLNKDFCNCRKQETSSPFDGLSI